MAGLPASRIPTGENGVASAVNPLSRTAARAAARLERVRTLRCGDRRLATGVYLTAAAVVVVPTVAVVIPWLSAALPAAGLQ